MQFHHYQQLQKNLRRAESGQAIIIIAFVTIFLLGALGMAIDGGNLYFLRHDAGNATDAAVLAAVYALCTNASDADVVAAATNAAQSNGFVDGVNGTSVAVNVNPDIDGDTVPDDNYVVVQISAPQESFFIHLLYDGSMGVQTYASGYCEPPFDPFALNTSVFTTGNGCTCYNKPGINLSGANTDVEGDWWTNSCVDLSGSSFEQQDGTMNAGTGIDDNAGYTNLDGNPTNPAASPPKDMPIIWEYADFDIGGDIHTEVTGTCPTGQTCYTKYAGDHTFFNGDDIHEGVHFAPNGTIDIKNGADFIDHIDTGTVVGGQYVAASDGRYQYTFVADRIKGNSMIAASGDANDFIEYYTEGLLTFSERVQDCTDIGASSYATDWSGQGKTKGIMYAPYGSIFFSNNNVCEQYGPIIANAVRFSIADCKLFKDPTLKPPSPPSVSIAQ